MAAKEKAHTTAEHISLDRYVFKEEIAEYLPADRMLVTLSNVLSIKETDNYWIHLYGRELGLRTVDGKGYAGRTFEGVPTEPGYYSINLDMTFTQLADKNDIGRSRRLYVHSIAAAKAARGEDYGVLHLVHSPAYMDKMDSIISIFPSVSMPGNLARMATMPRKAIHEEKTAITEALRKEA